MTESETTTDSTVSGLLFTGLNLYRSRVMKTTKDCLEELQPKRVNALPFPNTLLGSVIR